MKILFVLRKVGHLRLFEQVIEYMLKEGIEVSLLLSQRPSDKHETSLLSEFSRRNERVNLIDGEIKKSRLDDFQEYLLSWLHRLRYDENYFANAHGLVSRSHISLRKKAPVSTLFYPVLRFGPRRGMSWLLRQAISSIPTQGSHTKFLQEINVDALIVSPLIEFNAHQVDWLKAAKSLNVPTFFAVHSWDNLTNKGSISIKPDFCLIWNRFQIKELEEIHGFPWTRTLVTGAFGYDEWFSRAKEELMHSRQEIIEVAMKSKPFILFVGSSKYIASDLEFEIVGELIKKLEKIGWGIVVRPHPQNPVKWHELSGENYLVYPEVGVTPVGLSRQDDYVSSICLSSAVIGINTSALLESLIFNKPTFILSNKTFSKGQRETLHFQYLLDSRCFGIVDSVDSLIDHISDASNFKTPLQQENRELFLSRFLRPKGLHKAAAKVFCELVKEKVAHSNLSRTPSERRFEVKNLARFAGKILILPILILMGVAYCLDYTIRLLMNNLTWKFSIDEKDKILLYKSMMTRRYIYVSLQIVSKLLRRHSKTRFKKVNKKRKSSHLF